MLERVELLLENVVDGFFGLILRGKIQPLEIARRLTREAEEEKIITLNRVFVPNRFVVGLHPADMALLKPIAPELEAEFARFVGEWAIDRDYAVTGPIRVTLTAQERVGRGRMRITSSTDDVRRAEEEARRRFGLEVRVETDECVGILELDEGPDAPRLFTLLPRRMTLGRGRECDIRLSDPELAACHAVLEPVDGTWRLEELNGGPPVRINDEETHEALLRDGDTIAVGSSRLRFRCVAAAAKVSGDGE